MHIVAKVVFNVHRLFRPTSTLLDLQQLAPSGSRLSEKYRYPGVPSGWFVLHSQKALRTSGCAALPPLLSCLFKRSLDFYDVMGAKPTKELALATGRWLRHRGLGLAARCRIAGNRAGIARAYRYPGPRPIRHQP